MINYVEKNQIDSLINRLCFSHHLRIDCCLDALSCTDGVRRLFQKEAGTPYTLLFADTSYADMSSASPYLLQLEHGHDFLTWLILEGRKFGFLGVTYAEPEMTHAHWRSLLNTLMPDGSISHFRFYSSHTLGNVLRTSSEKEISWLLGPYAFLLLPGETEDQWTVATHPTMLTDSENGNHVDLLAQKVSDSYSLIEGTWWQTTEEHLAGMKGVLDKVFRANIVQYLWENEPLKALDVSQQYKSLLDFVNRAVTKAKQWGFEEPEHLTYMTLLYLNNGLDFDNAQPVRDILRVVPDNAQAALISVQNQISHGDNI